MAKPVLAENATLTLRVSQEWLDALDQWRNEQIVPPTRTQVIKVAVEQLIAEHSKAAGAKKKRET